MNWHELSALDLGAQIERGNIDPRELARFFLARIEAADPERQVFVRTMGPRALAEADAARARQRASLRRSRLDGVPLSWKDLFDTAGVATEGGSRLLKGRVPEHDAEVLRRLTRAGTVALGKTSMSEFAFSGLGVNPIAGQAVNPFDPETPRAPGGSSSGAAVGLALGLSAAALGTDTAGSVRIPAAWNGLVGLKTTKGLIPLDGVLPLSRSYDTAGPIAKTVAEAAALFALMTGTPAPDLAGAELARAVFLVPDDAVAEAEAPVRAAFERALDALIAAGARLVRRPVAAFAQAQNLLDEKGNPVGAEASAEWAALIAAAPEMSFKPIAERIRLGSGMDAPTLASIRHRLDELALAARAEIAGCNAVLLPATSNRPPPLAPLTQDGEAHAKANLAALRFTRLANFLGLCALALPAGKTAADAPASELPFGLQIVGPPLAEARLLRLGAAMESELSRL